jgi:hypothetical protein
MVTAGGGRQSAADAADAVKQQIRGVFFCLRRQLLLSYHASSHAPGACTSLSQHAHTLRLLPSPPLLYHSAAALAVIAAAASTTVAAAGPFSSPVEGTAGKEADYSHFAEMLASVMMMREGGVDKAMEAVPMLHDTTHAYIKTMSLAETHPEWFSKNGTKAADWGGLKDGDLDLLKAIKDANATEYEKDDPLTELGEKIKAKMGDKDVKSVTKDWETEKVEKFEKMLPQVR